jgi:LacI family xylobiose transport system transcriptional regulator
MAEFSEPKSTLAVIVDSTQSEFVQQALESLQGEAGWRRWSIQSISVGAMNPLERQGMLARMLDQKLFAAAAVLQVALSAEEAALFHARRVPLGILAGSMEGAHWVATDEADGGSQVAARLIRLGHRRMGILSGPDGAPECALREEGFLRKLEAEGLAFDASLLARAEGFSARQGKQACKALLSLPERPSAIFVAGGDLLAQGALSAAREAGLRVPYDLSLVGYDNLSLSQASDPPLCSVRQPLHAMALRLFRSLTDAVAKPGLPPLAQRINPLLVLRKSCAAPGLPAGLARQAVTA